MEQELDDVVRQRIRGLRLAKGWTLDSLASRCEMSPSTLSRIETGGRRVALDQIVAIARALGTSVDQLVEPASDEDVVIRPQPHDSEGVTVWPLSGSDTPGGVSVAKMRIVPGAPVDPKNLGVHPGREWFTVLSGTVELWLGDRVDFEGEYYKTKGASIYDVPLSYHAEGLDGEVLRHFGLTAREPDLARWHDIVDRHQNPEGEVTIGVVGKYVGLQDAYKSLNEALVHGGMANRVKVNVRWIDAEVFEKEDAEIAAQLEPMHGILVPGGFGERGSEGKIASVRFARERNVPFFGICLGMQIALIEYARDVAGLKGANSTEFDLKCAAPVVALIDEWQTADGSVETRDESADLGGTMRLGAQKSELVDGAKIRTIYGQSEIIERHRHRYEMNDRFIETIEQAGMKISGYSSVQHLVETVEIPEHPWFIAVQFHPEFTSSPRDGHPLFAGFIEAAKKQHQK